MGEIALGRLWAEATARVRSAADVVLPVAGAFYFLPQLLFSLRTGDATNDQLFAGGRLPGDILAFVLLGLFGILGQLLLTMILLQRPGTVGGLLRLSFALIPAALAASLIQGIGVGFGLMLLVVPGLYLFARLMMVMPVIAVEAPDPLRAISRSWALTKGHGLRLLGIVAMVMAGFLLVTLAVNGLGAALGVVSTVAGGGQPESGWGIGRWLFELVRAALSAGLGVYFMAFLASLYQSLTATR